MIREASLVLWTTNQWLFTSHYLKVACLIKLTFSKHSLDSLHKMQKRLRMLTAIDFLVYSSFAIVFGYSFLTVQRQLFNQVFWAISQWIVALVSLLSMIHIQRQTDAVA